jgi:hypothetical protein
MNMEHCVNSLRTVIDESGIDRIIVVHAPALWGGIARGKNNNVKKHR